MKKGHIGFIAVCLVMLGVFVSAETLRGFEGEHEVNLEKGWNLVSLYAANGDVFDVRGNQELMNTLKEKGIRAVFYYDKYNERYIQLYPNHANKEKEVLNFLSKMGNEGDERFIENYGTFANFAIWIYSEKPQLLKYRSVDGPLPMENVKLRVGWNFLAITSDMKGKAIKEIAGSCNIERAYYWNANARGSSGWSEIGENNNRVDEENVNYGIVIKVLKDCMLGQKEAESPPAIPM